MIDTELYDYIYDNFTLSYDFYYGSAEGATGAYAVMFKVEDLERPTTFCDEQGETGRALFQFSFYDGGSSGGNTNAVEVLRMAEDFKEQFKDIIGTIGVTTQYRIDDNETRGARLLGQENSTYDLWGAFFEAEIWWNKL